MTERSADLLRITEASSGDSVAEVPDGGDGSWRTLERLEAAQPGDACGVGHRGGIRRSRKAMSRSTGVKGLGGLEGGTFYLPRCGTPAARKRDDRAVTRDVAGTSIRNSRTGHQSANESKADGLAGTGIPTRSESND